MSLIITLAQTLGWGGGVWKNLEVFLCIPPLSRNNVPHERQELPYQRGDNYTE